MSKKNNKFKKGKAVRRDFKTIEVANRRDNSRPLYIDQEKQNIIDYKRKIEIYQLYGLDI